MTDRKGNCSMKYKTRGGTSPHGKPRVYFTGAEEDCGASFERISELILSMHNCVIYYEENPYAPELTEELLLGMQLVVIAVTRRYIHQDTFAHNFVFRTAVQNHIPVLPILEESGIEAAFNRKCGNIQFLNLNSADATEISSVRKLELFLNAVLIGDELSERIKQAFDAYVFLSYRKKDRKYANELMQLIHSNEMCRDLAIWYDEYLIPGENFNQAIEAALNQCDLFTLLVTENLLEKPNYVMDMEYPAARKAGKTIFPVLMSQTDETRLKEYYEDMPHPTEPAHLDDALQKAFADILRPERNNSPKHLFFIGLAYLEGIYVEVNHGRAREMIEAAAEQGLTEAMQKLSDMYLHGNGVSVDYAAAIAWKRKLADAYKKEYDTDGNKNSLIGCFEALLSVGDDTSKYIGEKEGYQAYQFLAEQVRQFLKQTGLYRPAHFIVLAYQKQSVLLLEHNHVSKAVRRIRKAVKESERLYHNELTVYCSEPEKAFLELAALDKGRSLLAYGDILYAKGKKWKANIKFLLGRPFVLQAEKLVTEHDNDPDILMQIEAEKLAMYGRWINLIADGSLSNVAGIDLLSDIDDLDKDGEDSEEFTDIFFSGDDDDDEAELFFVRDITEKVLEKYGNLRQKYLETKAKSDLIPFAAACDSVRKMYTSQKRFAKAKEACLEIIRLLEPVRKADSYFLFAFMLIRCYAQLAVLSAKTDDLPAAAEALQKCSAICDQIKTEPDQIAVCRCIYELCRAEGAVQAAGGNHAAAKEKYLSAIRAYKKARHTDFYSQDMYELYAALGAVNQELGAYRMSLKNYRTALRFSKRIKNGFLDKTMGMRKIRKMNIYCQIADLYMKQAHYKKALRYYRKARTQALFAAGAHDPDSIYQKGMLYYKSACCARRAVQENVFRSKSHVNFQSTYLVTHLDNAHKTFRNLSVAFPDVRDFEDLCNRIQDEKEQWEQRLPENQ